jgi:hypothetical protein
MISGQKITRPGERHKTGKVPLIGHSAGLSEKKTLSLGENQILIRDPP